MIDNETHKGIIRTEPVKHHFHIGKTVERHTQPSDFTGCIRHV